MAFAAGGDVAGPWAALEGRTFLVDQLDDISREGAPARVSTGDVARAGETIVILRSVHPERVFAYVTDVEATLLGSP